jgi:hypothetical protein
MSDAIDWLATLAGMLPLLAAGGLMAAAVAWALWGERLDARRMDPGATRRRQP